MTSIVSYGADPSNSASTNVTGIQNAASAAASGDKEVRIPNGTFQVGTGLSSWPDGVALCGDDGAALETTETGSVNVLDLSGTEGVRTKGEISFIGPGGANNEVIGIYASGASKFRNDGQLNFNSFSRACQFDVSDECDFGDMYGETLYGKLRNSTDKVGTLLSVNGVVASTYGVLEGKDHYKPVLYLGVVSAGQGVDNEISTNGGAVTGKAGVFSGSSLAVAVAVRSGVNCSFGSVRQDGGYRSIMVQQEAADDYWNVDGISFSSVHGNYQDQSGGEGIVIDSLHETKRIGSVSIGSGHIRNSSLINVRVARCDNFVCPAMIGDGILNNHYNGLENFRIEDSTVNLGQWTGKDAWSHGFRFLGSNPSRGKVESIIAIDPNHLNNSTSIECMRADQYSVGNKFLIERIEHKKTSSGNSIHAVTGAGWATANDLVIWQQIGPY